MNFSIDEYEDDTKTKFVEMPREMMYEIVRYVGPDGLLALRKVCRLTKIIAEETCIKQYQIDHIRFWHNEGNANLQIVLSETESPPSLIDYKNCIERTLSEDQQTLELEMPVDEFPNFLHIFRERIQRCLIGSFLFMSCDQKYIEMFASFLKDLTVLDSCLHAYGFSDWNLAIATVQAMHLNAAKMSVHGSIEDVLKMAEVVESVILETDHADHEDVDIVSILLNMYFKRCKYIHTNCLLSYVQVYQLIHILPALGKDVYLFAHIEENVPKVGKFRLGSLTCETNAKEEYSFIEISFDEIDREYKSFIPIIGDQDWLQPGASTLAYHTMIVIEIVAIIYNTLFATLSIGIWRSTSVFHRNMVNLGVVLYFNAGKLRNIAQHNNYLGFFSENLSRMHSDDFVWIICRVIERIFATIFLNDYERKSRHWISHLLITTTVLVSSGITVSRTFNSAVITTKIFNTIQYAYAFIPSMIGVVVVFYNYRRRNRILLSPRYSLGAKFQLQENMRAFKFLVFCMFWAVITIAVAGAIFQYMDLHHDDLNIVTLCGAAFETATTIIYALSVSTTFFSIREWRSAIRVKIARMFILCRRKSTFEAPEAPQPPPSLKGKRAEAESDIYFGDLAVAWDKCLRSKEAKSGRL